MAVVFSSINGHNKTTNQKNTKRKSKCAVLLHTSWWGRSAFVFVFSCFFFVFLNYERHAISLSLSVFPSLSLSLSLSSFTTFLVLHATSLSSSLSRSLCLLPTTLQSYSVRVLFLWYVCSRSTQHTTQPVCVCV